MQLRHMPVASQYLISSRHRIHCPHPCPAFHLFKLSSSVLAQSRQLSRADDLDTRAPRTWACLQLSIDAVPSSSHPYVFTSTKFRGSKRVGVFPHKFVHPSRRPFLRPAQRHRIPSFGKRFDKVAQTSLLQKNS